MTTAAVHLHGHADLIVTAPDGSVTARAEAHNMVLNGGLRYLALIIAGRATQPALGAIVGTSGAPSAPDMTIINAPEGWQPAAATNLTVDGPKVTFKATFAAAAADTVIQEAGVELSVRIEGADTTRLYNRAVINPGLQVRKDEVLTVNWTLTFGSAQA
jgi:hypothetical protein